MTENPQNEMIVAVVVVPRDVPITLEHGNDINVDVLSAQRIEHADGSLTSLVTWLELPRDQELTP